MCFKKFFKKFARHPGFPVNRHEKSQLVEKHGLGVIPMVRYTGNILSFVEILIKNPSGGSPLKREVLHRKDVVSVMPYNPFDHTILLGKEHRAGAELHENIDPFLIGTFAGIRNTGESDAKAAMRELQEEANLDIQIGQLIPVCGASSFTSAGGSSERVMPYIALCQTPFKAEKGLGQKDENEDIETLVLDFNDALAKVKSGEIMVDTAIMSLFYIACHQEQLKENANLLFG